MMRTRWCLCVLVAALLFVPAVLITVGAAAVRYFTGMVGFLAFAVECYLGVRMFPDPPPPRVPARPPGKG